MHGEITDQLKFGSLEVIKMRLLHWTKSGVFVEPQLIRSGTLGGIVPTETRIIAVADGPHFIDMLMTVVLQYLPIEEIILTTTL